MIYITGDIHGEPRERFAELSKSLTEKDIVIICGDFGLPWWSKKYDKSFSDKRKLDWLEEQKAAFIYVDGNHENFHLLNAFAIEEWNGGKVHKIRPNVLHLMRGEIFDINGYKVFCFGGALSVDKMYREENISWWPEEIYSQQEFDNAVNNLEKVSYTVDIVITHTAPQQLFKYNPYFLKYAHSIDIKMKKDKTSDMLTQLYPSIKYGKWYFGHFHVNCRDKYKRCECLYEDIRELRIDKP